MLCFVISCTCHTLNEYDDDDGDGMTFTLYNAFGTRHDSME